MIPMWFNEGLRRLWYRDFDYSLSDREKVGYRQAAYGIPFFGSALEANDRLGYYDDYLRNRGMTWADVKYPFMLNTGIGSMVSSGTNFISANVSRLYRTDTKERVSRAYDRGFRNGYRWHR